MIRRFVEEESGVVMGLAVIMIVLIGVMGAGLLTFVATDLNTVVEVNQGQKAFEMADSGVQAAKKQLFLASDPKLYDGGNAGSVEDSQWSYAKGGMNLSLDGNTVNVKIRDTSTPDRTSFTVISEGKVGQARRKIEAVYTTTGVSGIPAYYAPGDINLQNSTSNNAISGMSFFSGRNIILKDFDFSQYGSNSASIKIQTGVRDPLGDWNQPPWNTVGRTKDGVSFEDVGFAAEGYICKSTSCPIPDDDPAIIAGPSDSGYDQIISDGVYGYDRTTGSKGNQLKFVEKIPPHKNPNDPGTITYPFPRREPNIEGLLTIARSGGIHKYTNMGSSPNWDNLYTNSPDDRVVFIDANGNDVQLSFSNSSRRAQGILVVRCGNLTIEDEEFTGVVLVVDDPSRPSTCAGKSKYKSEKASVKGYVYAESIAKDDALYVDSDSTIANLPAGKENLLELAFPGKRLQSWRELYQ
jgi:hypothetical protein